MTRSDPDTFIFYGNGTFLNRGCQAIAVSTVSMLQNQFGQCKFINLPPYPQKESESAISGVEMTHVSPSFSLPRRWSPHWIVEQTKKRLLSRPFMDCQVKEIEKAVKPYASQSLATLCLGGDNYSLDYGIPGKYFAANEAFYRCKQPIVIWGASIGPFDSNPSVEQYAGNALRKVDLICARESLTVEYLESLGITENVELVTDPAFLLEPRKPRIDKQLENFIKQGCLGVNLSPLIDRYFRGDDSGLERITRNMRRLLENVDMPILFIPHVWKSKKNNDYLFMRKIMAMLGSFDNKTSIVEPHYNCQELKWIISNMRAFVGARTHATISSLSSGVPTISIGYSIKSKGINIDIFGHSNWVCSVDDLDKNDLCELVVALLEAETSVRENLRVRIPAVKEKAKEAAVHLSRVLKSKS